MRSPLFREEAVAYQREPVRGNVLLATSPRSTWLAVLAFVIAASLGSYAVVGEFSRKAHVQGYLAPNKGLIKVYPDATGTLLERRVDEGQHVRKGDVLAVISTERSSLSVADANATTLALLAQRELSLARELAGQREIQQLRVRRVDEQLASFAINGTGSFGSGDRNGVYFGIRQYGDRDTRWYGPYRNGMEWKVRPLRWDERYQSRHCFVTVAVFGGDSVTVNHMRAEVVY